LNQVHIFKSNIHFNIIFPSIPTFQMLINFTIKNSICMSHNIIFYAVSSSLILV
jgi:hypothetical protein